MKKHPADGGDEEVRLGKTRVTDEDMRDLERNMPHTGYTPDV